MRACVMVVTALLLGCGTRREVTVRIRPPAGPEVSAEIFRPGERCVVLAAAPLDSADTTVHMTVYRAQGVVAEGAGSCFGASGAPLLEGLVPDATYLVEMVILDPDDYVPALTDPSRPRIVSLQDFPLPGNPEASYICLSDPTRSPVWRPILERAVQLCREAPIRAACVLDMPVGGVCPAGSR